MPRSGVAVSSPWEGPVFRARWVGRSSVHRSGKDWGGGKAPSPEGYGATPGEALTEMVASRGGGRLLIHTTRIVFAPSTSGGSNRGEYVFVGGFRYIYTGDDKTIKKKVDT